MGRQTMTAFGLAQDRHYYKDGEERAFTSFFDCEAWGEAVPAMSEGDIITVRGRLREDRWLKNGRNKSRMKVIVEAVEPGPVEVVRLETKRAG
jgi:single-stranded DNA-binding protein